MSSVTELPRSRYDDPLARIDWSAVDRDCWWLPPSAISLCGVPEFEALPLKMRQRLSQLEYVHLLQSGLWLESQFIARLSTLAHRSDDIERQARFLHEVREEAGHSLMFVELLHRSGFGVQRDRGLAARAIDVLGRLLPSDSALFWAMVVIGEELPDRLNHRLRRGIEDATLSAVVYRMAKIHMRDEAAHAAYARKQCEQSARRCARWKKMLFSPLISRAMDMYARYVYFPPVATYARAGLSPARKWRERALDNPVRLAQAAEMVEPTLFFLRRNGWPVSSGFAQR